jgi:xylan 1,4-beta-xylosidase
MKNCFLKKSSLGGLAAIIVLSVAASATCGGSLTNRTISADLLKVKGPRSMAWQDCVGAGRVAEGLRDDWRKQLLECRQEIGFKHLRMHGLFQDDLGVYSEGSDGRAIYNWQYLDNVYDFLLSSGIKPFVEFGFMPTAMASGDAKIFWWQANVTPPKEYAKWQGLISAAVRHWTRRYGEEEVRQWRFEVWNEPNYPGFWHPPDGVSPRDEYFKLYEKTVRAVQSVNTNYIVGGPAGAGPVWTAELIGFCDRESLPLDFISYHAYGLGDGPSGLDEYGNRKLYLSPNILSVADAVNSQLPVIESSSRPGLPVYITEWSASYSPRDPVHDSYFSAAFILEQLRHTESVKAMSYWTFTDVFEENGPPPRPFHGGFGLINLQGIRKPAFWAWKYLAGLGPVELQNTDASSYVCSDNDGGVQVLLWDITHPTGGTVSDQEFFFHKHPSADRGSVKVSLKNLKPGDYQLVIRKTGYGYNDPYSRYIEMGQPCDLSIDAVAGLKALSSDKPILEHPVVVPPDGCFETTLSLHENDVYFLSLERKK